MGLLAIMQSCSKENDLPISKEKTIAQQTASQKLASSIRVISVNKPIASLTLDGTVGLDLDNNLTDDLIFSSTSYGIYVKSNLGVLKYKANKNLLRGPYRLSYGQASPVGGAVFSIANKESFFINLPNEMTYYIGFKVLFSSDNKIHFGWARVKQKYEYAGYIYEVAINDAPNTPVFAGEI